MSWARITKHNTRHSWRLSLGFIVLVMLWGFWLMTPFRRIAGLVTGYVYDVSLNFGLGRYLAIILTMVLSLAVVFLVSRWQLMMLIVSVAGLTFLFAADIYRVAIQLARPDVLWPTLIWVAIAIAVLLSGIRPLRNWFAIGVPVSVIVFWFYDAVIRLLATLGVLPVFGNLLPNPAMSYTFNLDGLLGVPGSVFVLLPVLGIVAILLTYREA